MPIARRFILARLSGTGDNDLLPSGITAKAFKERYAPFGQPAPTIGRTAGQIIPLEESVGRLRTIRWKIATDEKAQTRVNELSIKGGVSKYLKSLVLDDWDEAHPAE
jgi:hypothetical protein